jgi:hypothetical protein
MKGRHPESPDQVIFTAILIGLALLVTVLWFTDPAHRYSGHSRVGWPPPAPSKP